MGRELVFPQQSIPLEPLEILLMLMSEGVLVKMRGGKLLEHLVDNFRICWGVEKRCGVNRAIKCGKGMMKLFLSSLSMVCNT
jgi:hypothetical protein